MNIGLKIGPNIGSMLKTILRVLVLVCAAAFAPGIASAAVDPTPFLSRDITLNKQVLEVLNDAQKAMQEGRTQDAVQALNLAYSLEPSNPNILARLAVVLNMSGKYEDALDRLRFAKRKGATADVVLAPMLDAMLSLGQNQVVLDLFPDPGPAQHDYAAGIILRARASALQALGDRAGATAALARSLAILSDYDGVMTAGRILLLQGDFDGADARVDQALKLKPGDFDAQALKIDLAMQKHMPAKARDMAERLVAAAPRSMLAILIRAKVYLSIDRADKAEADIDRVLADKPDLPIALYFKAIVLARHGDPKGAWDIAHSLPKEYIQVDPGIALNVANMAVAAGYLDSAASLLNVAVLRFPDQFEARLQLADIRLRQNSPQYALNALAMVQDSKDPRVEVLYARIALMKNAKLGAQKYIQRVIESGGGEELRALDKDVALKSLADYIARNPSNQLVKKQYAVLLLGFGELDKARTSYEQLVRDYPTDGHCLNNLAWLVVKDDPARALVLAQRAVKADPGSPDFLDTLGSMQLNRSDRKGAVETLQKAHAFRPDDPEIAYHLALALEASGEGGKSQALLQNLVKRGGGFGDLDAAKNLLASKLRMVGQTQSGH
jgi:tetratricopeptide (TPR) repeat protein